MISCSRYLPTNCFHFCIPIPRTKTSSTIKTHYQVPSIRKGSYTAAHSSWAIHQNLLIVQRHRLLQEAVSLWFSSVQVRCFHLRPNHISDSLIDPTLVDGRVKITVDIQKIVDHERAKCIQQVHLPHRGCLTYEVAQYMQDFYKHREEPTDFSSAIKDKVVRSTIMEEVHAARTRDVERVFPSPNGPPGRRTSDTLVLQSLGTLISRTRRSLVLQPRKTPLRTLRSRLLQLSMTLQWTQRLQILQSSKTLILRTRRLLALLRSRNALPAPVRSARGRYRISLLIQTR